MTHFFYSYYQYFLSNPNQIQCSIYEQKWQLQRKQPRKQQAKRRPQSRRKHPKQARHHQSLRLQRKAGQPEEKTKRNPKNNQQWQHLAGFAVKVFLPKQAYHI